MVGREVVAIEAFTAYVDAVTSEPWQSVNERVASRLLDQFLDQEVVAAAAGDRREFKIPAEPGQRSTVVRSLLAELCGPVPLTCSLCERGIEMAAPGRIPTCARCEGSLFMRSRR